MLIKTIVVFFFCDSASMSSTILCVAPPRVFDFVMSWANKGASLPFCLLSKLACVLVEAVCVRDQSCRAPSQLYYYILLCCISSSFPYVSRLPHPSVLLSALSSSTQGFRGGLCVVWSALCENECDACDVQNCPSALFPPSSRNTS